MPLEMIMGRDLILMPYTDHPKPPVVKRTYMGREIIVAGNGAIFQTEITPGTNAMVVSVAEKYPSVSLKLNFLSIIHLRSPLCGEIYRLRLLR